MASTQFEPPEQRRIRRRTGQTCGPADNRHSNESLYTIPTGASSSSMLRTSYLPPPLPYRSSDPVGSPPAPSHPPQHMPPSPPPFPSHAFHNPHSSHHLPLYHHSQPPTASRSSLHPSRLMTTLLVSLPVRNRTGSDLTTCTSSLALGRSMSELVSHGASKANATILELEGLVLRCINGDHNVRDNTSLLLDGVITSMDNDLFCGRENELLAACTRPFRLHRQQRRRQSSRPGQKKTSRSTDYFSKVYLYANSRMPPSLPQLRLDPPICILLKLAAHYSKRAYRQPRGQERRSYVDADWLQGTKAMVIKSLPVDEAKTIVFAIRGTQSFMDWTVNVQTAPVPPTGFLNDPSNKCHSGFLRVARKMVAPVAAALRALLEEDPSRSDYNLLMTGHSAGGAVASLLYLHLLSESAGVHSELIHLRGCFREVHCVTFGAPPISLWPLATPRPAQALSRSFFIAVVNEGDPVPRADKAYFFSLLDLYASPAPAPIWTTLASGSKPISSVHWKVPRTTLSIAGRIALLRARGRFHGRSATMHNPSVHAPPVLPPREDLELCGTTDAELSGVVFGDPLMHTMDLYARRIDTLVCEAARGSSQ
ncbi:uncharacterized protein N7482_007910 [Penicillium canariense]|uniref:Fungal lipase-type domain-containing protein n=1 Tax=Penicillium canariense TaxID=189055 RepID=A0A9W9LL13_9EURO|nr:uncharacterized protein N7482_007910 [Penicillium canariense]KAJ5160906.1 hypothetical protein N7482_007910 [Penicillium canariense]